MTRGPKVLRTVVKEGAQVVMDLCVFDDLVRWSVEIKACVALSLLDAARRRHGLEELVRARGKRVWARLTSCWA